MNTDSHITLLRGLLGSMYTTTQERISIRAAIAALKAGEGHTQGNVRVRCNECQGDGYTYGGGGPAHRTNEIPCEACGGTGKEMLAEQTNNAEEVARWLSMKVPRSDG